MSFDPNKHLIEIKTSQGNKPYLPVVYRIAWFRDACTEGSIETEMVHLDLDRETEEEVFVWNAERRRSEKVVKRAMGFVIFRAVVKDGKGNVASGTKSEKAAAFGDFIEKAESGAIGRALAALGYGTQWTSDELDASHEVVEATGSSSAKTDGSTNEKSPASQEHRPTKPVQPPAPPSKPTGPATPAELITEQQSRSITKLCSHLGRAVPDMSTMTFETAGKLIQELSTAYKEARATLPVR
jgi:hypothetical protein